MDTWEKELQKAYERDLENYTTKQLEDYYHQSQELKKRLKLIQRVLKAEIKRRKRMEELQETIPKVS